MCYKNVMAQKKPSKILRVFGQIMYKYDRFKQRIIWKKSLNIRNGNIVWDVRKIQQIEVLMLEELNGID